MTNYGTKFNETPKTVDELERKTLRWQGETLAYQGETLEQAQARVALQFIERNPEARLHRSEFAKAELRFSAEWARAKLANDRYPWEPRTPGHVHDEPVAEYKWLANLLDPNPPWWRRLWRWIDPRKQFRDWDRDDRYCRRCGTQLYPTNYSCPGCQHWLGIR